MLKWSLLVLSASWHCCLKILNNSILELGFSKFNGVIKYAYEQRTQIHYVSLPHLHIVFLVSSEPRILVDPQYVGAEQTPIECKCLWLNGGWHWQPQEIMASVWTRTIFQSRNKAILKKKKKEPPTNLIVSFHTHFFPVLANHLCYNWWQRKKGKDRARWFLSFQLLPYFSVSWRHRT